jgi:hypothetical protein
MHKCRSLLYIYIVVSQQPWLSWLLSLQSEEILNRTVCVLDILNRVWTLLKILNIDWTESEHILNILNITENSEQIPNILNITENS